MNKRQVQQIRKGIRLARLNYPRFDWRNAVNREPFLVMWVWRRYVEKLETKR